MSLRPDPGLRVDLSAVYNLNVNQMWEIISHPQYIPQLAEVGGDKYEI